LLVALALVADVGFVTHARGVVAGHGNVHSRFVTEVVGAGVVIVTEVGSNRREHASGRGVARVVGARVSIVASNGGVDALGFVNIARECAGVVRARVLVVALAVVHASRNRRTQVGEVDHTGGRNALVVGALGVGGNRDGGEDAALHRIARWLRAKVRSSARWDGGVDAHGGRGDHGVSHVARVDGARVLVVAVHVGVALRNGASRLVHDNSLHRVARHGGTTVGDNRERNGSLLTTHDRIASRGVTHVLGGARDVSMVHAFLSSQSMLVLH